MSDLITEPETFESSRKRTGLLLAFWVFLFAFAVIMVKTESGPNGNRFLVVFGLLAFLLFSSLIVVFLVSLVSGRPKIVVSPVGLKFYETIRTDTWQWWEVGPFVALEDPSVSTSMFYLCAYTQRNYEVLLAAGKNAVPDLASADVRIPVFLLLDGRTLGAANGMANRVHDWRIACTIGETDMRPIELPNPRQRVRRKPIN